MPVSIGGVTLLAERRHRDPIRRPPRGAFIKPPALRCSYRSRGSKVPALTARRATGACEGFSRRPAGGRFGGNLAAGG